MQSDDLELLLSIEAEASASWVAYGALPGKSAEGAHDAQNHTMS
jgi:hypothetical protein